MSEETDAYVDEARLAWWSHQDGTCDQDCQYCGEVAEEPVKRAKSD